MLELDTLDRKIAHALQIDGRAPFSRIASALCVSDQTVARRYARLRSSRALRVVGLSDVDAMGGTQWFVRVKATPDGAVAIAANLARRTDTSWVMLMAGGTEILFTAQTSADFRDADSVLAALPRTTQVLDVRAHCQLHQFFGGRRGAVEKPGFLSTTELEALAQGRAELDHLPRAQAPFESGESGESAESAVGVGLPAKALVNDVDVAILRELALDGRLSTERLSRAVQSPAPTVRRRIEALVKGGVLYFDVELDNQLLDNRVEAVLWLTVAPSSLHAAGLALGKHREVAFAAACTGPAALLAYVSVADTSAFYSYLTSSVATLPGVIAVDSAPVIRVLKAAGTLLPR